MKHSDDTNVNRTFNYKIRAKANIPRKCAAHEHLDWSNHVGLFNAQHNLPGNSDPIEQVVDEAHVVDERVHVAGAEHEQRGQALQRHRWGGDGQ